MWAPTVKASIGPGYPPENAGLSSKTASQTIARLHFLTTIRGLLMNRSVFTGSLAQLQRVFAASAVAGLVACGGGSDDAAPMATKLSGTAAVGAPIAGGAVQALCSGGGKFQATTLADGTWQIDTTGASLPCGLRVTGGSLAAGQALHSAALSFANVNITPLTDLMLANALGQLPSVWWGSSGPADFASITGAKLDQALVKLRTAFGLPALEKIDPRTAAFKAVAKDPVDDVLEAMRLALAKGGTDYASLLTSASNAAFALSQGFRITLGEAYTTVTVGGAGTVTTPGTPPGAIGNFTLTINAVVSGASVPPITIENIAKPATQAEFCDDLLDPNSSTGLNQQMPGGSVSINSCAFNGTTGNVSATLSITSPAMTIPYTIAYSYK